MCVCGGGLFCLLSRCDDDDNDVCVFLFVVFKSKKIKKSLATVPCLRCYNKCNPTLLNNRSWCDWSSDRSFMGWTH